MTYGLPSVFARHPVIDIKGMTGKIIQQLGQHVQIKNWYCGETIERTSDLHIIPLFVEVVPSAP